MTPKRMLAGAVLSLAAANASAQDDTGIEFRGFFTAGFTTSDVEETYLRNTTDDINFDEDSVLGLQVIAPISDRLTVQGQLLANGASDLDGGFDVNLDWAFASYQATEKLVVRGGRIRQPMLMHTEYVEVGYSYPWIRPPQEVYLQTPFNAVDGMDLLFETPLTAGWELSLQPYFGEAEFELALGAGVIADVDLTEIKGLRAQVRNDLLTLHANTSQVEIEFPALMFEFDADLLNFGAELRWNNFVAMAEHADRDFSVPTLSDDQAWYVMVAYQFGRWMPHVTVAEVDSDNLQGRRQDSLTVGTRFEVNDSAALKFEWSNAEPQDGTSGLFVTPLATDNDANIFSVALDVIF